MQRYTASCVILNCHDTRSRPQNSHIWWNPKTDLVQCAQGSPMLSASVARTAKIGVKDCKKSVVFVVAPIFRLIKWHTIGELFSLSLSHKYQQNHFPHGSSHKRHLRDFCFGSCRGEESVPEEGSVAGVLRCEWGQICWRKWDHDFGRLWDLHLRRWKCGKSKRCEHGLHLFRLPKCDVQPAADFHQFQHSYQN